jgi:large subunit ribosomal protein L4
MKLDVHTLGGAKKASGSIDVSDEIFGITEIRADILQRMVKYQLAKRRAGTHHAQTRSEVNRSHSKLYKQKGTGQARHGSANAPIFRGGGMAHAIHPRDYTHSLPKKVRAMALKHALSAKAGAKTLIVIEEAELKKGKTAELKAALGKLNIENALIIAGAEVSENLSRAARNIPNLDVLPSAGLNVYDVLRRNHLVLTKSAVDAIEARFKAPSATKQKAA